jgi:hypothetical protein
MGLGRGEDKARKQAMYRMSVVQEQMYDVHSAVILSLSKDQFR